MFELNEHTWAWIAEYPDTDCFTGLLEDLALYKNGEIKLSCCSHEELYEEITVPLPPPKGLDLKLLGLFYKKQPAFYKAQPQGYCKTNR